MLDCNCNSIWSVRYIYIYIYIARGREKERERERERWLVYEGHARRRLCLLPEEMGWFMCSAGVGCEAPV